MQKTKAVSEAVSSNRMVVACAYQGYLDAEVKAALPQGFNEKRFVAKFVDGELVAVRSGTPEQAIQSLLQQ